MIDGITCTTSKSWGGSAWRFTLSYDGRSHTGEIVSNRKPTPAECLEAMRQNVVGLKHLLGDKFTELTIPCAKPTIQ